MSSSRSTLPLFFVFISLKNGTRLLGDQRGKSSFMPRCISARQICPSPSVSSFSKRRSTQLAITSSCMSAAVNGAIPGNGKRSVATNDCISTVPFPALSMYANRRSTSSSENRVPRSCSTRAILLFSRTLPSRPLTLFVATCRYACWRSAVDGAGSLKMIFASSFSSSLPALMLSPAKTRLRSVASLFWMQCSPLRERRNDVKMPVRPLMKRSRLWVCTVSRRRGRLRNRSVEVA
mmetsp:Transcript_51130/g.121725  ORF Transcript_51130/g.121725 Transcript_51130/m.121725 type:complete len:235 (-) Transcript_51130:1568-2272(-)